MATAFQCPACGKKDFETEGGMKKHHYYVHGESLVQEGDLNVECPSCDREFVSERAVKVHHKKAHGESISDNISECNECGVEFMEDKGNSGNFCSMECYGESKRKREIRYCSYCHEEVERKSSRMKSDRIFCSEKCRVGYQDEYDDYHPWDGNGSSYRGPSWNGQRTKALERDGYQCQECGSEKESCYRLDVHHIEPFRDYGIENHERANRLENLVVLCRVCHMRVEVNYRES